MHSFLSRCLLWAAVIGLVLAAAADAEPLPPPAVGEAIPRPAAGENAPAALDLATALQWTLSGNPDLVSLRRSLSVSAAAVAVARQFPTSLNPTVTIDYQPWTFDRDTGQGAHRLEQLIGVTWSQPIELGDRTAKRLAIARAAYDQTHWNVLQAELQAMVETYRLHQTASYRRERLRVAQHLAEFNVQLLQTVRRQMEAAQASAADVVLAEVENQSMVERLQTAQQEYIDALTDLRRQIGLPECVASVVPAGGLKVPEGVSAGEEEELIRMALESHPEINAARAQAAGSHAALALARADRIVIPSVGPYYEHDEAGITYYGVALSSPIPVLNSGKPLVRQREMEHSRDVVAVEQLRIRTIARVRASLVRWNQTKGLVARVDAATAMIQDQTAKMERLYAAGQTDLLKLLQVRQRLIEAENAQLDMTWQATQAYSELLTALGATPLIGSLQPPADALLSLPVR
jgi:cobalt-zinc-cadmium efflux system outer membrane protein